LYRPSEGKVKNLKTKDYLGKARLIATSNTTNISTGFQGADRKQAIVQEIVGKDDRLPENISYAATNLVQKNLSSRLGREQSAPPVMGRNFFPPTPPPESEKPIKHSSTGTASGLNDRAASLRQPQPRQLAPYRQDSDFSTGRAIVVDPQSNSTNFAPLMSQDEKWPAAIVAERPRLMRSASESREHPSRRQYMDKFGSSRPPLFRETTPQRPFEASPETDTFDDVYRMYGSPQLSTSSRKPSSNRVQRQPYYIDEEAEYIDESYDNVNYVDEAGNFEMIGVNPSLPQAQALPVRSASRRPDMRRIRVKVHANDDTRYIMIGPSIEYGDFESKIREKFSIKSRLRIKMQDDGDMITMADQDDLEMLLQSVRSMARKERNEMGKMEVSFTISIRFQQKCN
jgi:PB1 domain